MAVSKPVLDAIKDRRTIYAISSENSPATIARVEEIITHVIKYTPSPYNSQSARAVILSGEHHKNYWNAVYEALPAMVPAEVWAGHLDPFVKAFRDGGVGTVMWFEDADSVAQLKQDHAAVAAFAESWSDQSSGMHQVNAWTALEAEGFGASLQHLHFPPAVIAYIHEKLGVPTSWQPKSQLVFGTPVAPAGEKTFKPIEARLKVF